MKLFETIGEQLGLPLHPSEREEYARIAREVQNSQYTPIQDNLEDRLENTIRAYKLIRAMQQALAYAQNHNQYAQWLEALRWAQEADKLLYALAETKFRKIVSPDIGSSALRTWGTSFNVLKLGWIGLMPLALYIVPSLNIHGDVKNNVLFCYCMLICAPVMIGITLEAHRTMLTRLFLFSQVQYVLRAAKRIHLRLDPAQIPEHPVMIEDPKQLTYEDRLAEIKFRKAPPSRYLCGISRQIMKKAMYSPYNPIHYDEDAISRWLDVKNCDPTTRQVLYISDLMFNPDLQQEIESWVARKEKKFARKAQKYHDLFGSRSLIAQSMFRHQSLDDDDIDDDMMLHSAFGQGSTTYQAAKRGYKL